MAKLGTFTVNVGDKVRACNKNSCGKYFSDHLSSCPHCGNSDYNVKVITQEIEREIERQ
jgi:uncharacterized OB-fold protein